jgi:hypothetical protein
VPPILRWFTFHEGRHTHATWLTEDGISEIARRARLGQKMKGIARVYDHVTPAMRQQILDALETRWLASLSAVRDHGSPFDLHLITKALPARKRNRACDLRKQVVGDTGIEPVTPTVSR